LAVGALFSLQLLTPAAARGRSPVEGGQAGEDRWVPSFTISSGLVFESQKGFNNSFQIQEGSTTPTSLQGMVDGSDLLVEPFVGSGLELMSPALPIPTRPRFFIGGEFLPIFSNDHSVAFKGDPSCIGSPFLSPQTGEPDPPGCVSEIDTTVIENRPTRSFEESGAQGQGVKTTATFDLLSWGANFGVAFPAQIYRRQLRIKPYLAWINYEVESNGLVVDAECTPANPSAPQQPLRLSRCIKTRGGPPAVNEVGDLRETILEGSASRRYNAIGPGLDVELDVVRYDSWLGVSLFMGARAYRTLGDRTISYAASQSFDDVFGMDTAFANWEVEIAPWMYRGHVGIRFQWLGLPD
jgi:hypothetical protein